MARCRSCTSGPKARCTAPTPLSIPAPGWYVSSTGRPRPSYTTVVLEPFGSIMVPVPPAQVVPGEALLRDDRALRRQDRRQPSESIIPVVEVAHARLHHLVQLAARTS